MSLMINQNITSLNAWRNLSKTDRDMSKTMEKLSSGLRINKAADDPAGLIISEQMRAQVVGLKAAIKNSEKGISMIQTAEAALDKMHTLLDKMRGLALDSANNATSDANMLAANQAEIDNILETITRISDNTQYGTKKLLNGDNWSATATLDSANNTAGVSQVLASDLAAGTASTLTVTVGTIATADAINNSATIWGGDGSGLDFSTAANHAASDLAGNLASGDHTVSITGALDSTANEAVVSGDTLAVATDGAISWNGSFTGELQFVATSVDDTAVAAATWDVYENSTKVGTATSSAAAFTITYDDGSQGATLSYGAGKITGQADTGNTFTVDVTASTAQVSLDGGSAVAIDNTTTLTDVAMTGTTGAQAWFDLDNVNFGTDQSYTFQVTKQGEAMARLGDGPQVVVGPNDTNVTLASRDGTVTLDFATIAAGTSTLNVADNSLVFQVGANEGQTVNIAIKDVAADHMAVVANAASGSDLASVTSGASLADIDVTTAAGAQDAVIMIDAAIDEISVIRGDLGAFQANTLEANLDSLRVSAENLQASESVIRDTDMAAEMAQFTKYQIMMQAGTSMLAQANQMPQNILQLLQG